MTVPNVSYRVLNGRLGVRAPGTVEMHAYVGPCSAGDVNKPTRSVRVDPVLDTFGGGPTVELAIGAVARWGADVLMVRSAAGVGGYGPIDVSGVTGTAVVSIDGSTDPDDDYEIEVEVVQGGTLGVAGIMLRASLTAGRDWLPTTALGTGVVTSAGKLTSSPTAFPAAMVAGDDFDGKVDQQAVADTVTIAATPATLTGAAATYAAVVAGHQLVLQIDGVSGTQAITFAGTENSQALFHAKINQQLVGGYVENDGGQTKLVTNVTGSAAGGAIVSGDADVLASLGLAAAPLVNAGPNNVANAGAVTAAELKALFDAEFTGGTAGSTCTVNADGSLTWASDTPGVSPKGVQLTGGTGVAKIDGFDLLEHNGVADTHVFEIPDTGGVKFNITAGTLATGSKWKIKANAPESDTSQMTAALATLKTTKHDWKAAWIAGPTSAAKLAAITAFLNDLEATTGKSRKVYVHVRERALNESKADYLAAVSAIIASIADFRITCCAESARALSARTGRMHLFRRPSIFAIAGLPAALPLKVDMAQTVDATPNGLPGVFLYDENENLVEHDEMLDPGLADARFLVLRTWAGKTGTFVNDPVTLEGPGLDFHLDQFVRILNVFCTTARTALVDEVKRDLDLNLKTNGANVAGAPTERECERIDKNVLEKLYDLLKTHVVKLEFKLHRDDLILSSQTLNADGGILFKGYPKQINFTVAAINPRAAG